VSGIAYGNVVNPTANVAYTYDAAYPRVTTMIDDVGTSIYTYNPITSTATLGVLPT
jgi:hypothetical protein